MSDNGHPDDIPGPFKFDRAGAPKPSPAARDDAHDEPAPTDESVSICPNCGAEIRSMAISGAPRICPHCSARFSQPTGLERYTKHYKTARYVILSWLIGAAVLFLLCIVSGWVVAWIVGKT